MNFFPKFQTETTKQLGIVNLTLEFQFYCDSKTVCIAASVEQNEKKEKSDKEKC